MQISTILKDNLIPKLKDINIIKKKIRSKIVSYIDSKNESLLCNGPFKRLIFSDLDKNFIIEKIYEMEVKEVASIIKKCEVIKSNWKIATDPFNIACTLLIYYLLKNKSEDEANLVLLFLSLRFYSSLQFKYFPYEPNENLTNYMVNNLSNKFKLKQLGTMLATIKDTADVCLDNYRKDMLNITNDLNIKDFIYGLETRLNGLMKNLKNEFEKIRKSGNYMNTEEDDYSKENYFLTDNTSSIINRIALNTSLYVISNPIDQPIVKIAAKLNTVSYIAIYNCINLVSDNKEDKTKEIITLIIQLYLMNPNNQIQNIKSMKFFNYADELYKKSNTKDSSIIRIKEILDEFLNDYCPIYIKTNRIATKISFRRAIFLYFVLVIQKNFKI